MNISPLSRELVLPCLSDPLYGSSGKGGNLYVEAVVTQLRGDLDDTKLNSSFQQIVDRQESLRACFKNIDGELLCQVLPPSAVQAAVTIVDMKKYNPTDDEVSRTLNSLAQQPFDLGTAPLVRLAAIHLHDDRHLLLLTYNHAIMDGSSQGVFFRELEAFYNGETTELPPLTQAYSDFAKADRQLLGEDVGQHSALVQEQLKYWKNKLAGAPELLELPTDYSRPPVCSWLGKMIVIPFPEETRKKVLAFMARERQSLLRVAMTALAITLSRYSQQKDIVLNVATLRKPREYTHTIGDYVNSLPIRLAIDDDVPFKDAVKNAGDLIKEAVAHGNVTFEYISHACGQSSTSAYPPISQVDITAHSAEWFEAPKLNGLVGEECHLVVDTGRSLCDVNMRVQSTDTFIRCQFVYNTEIFSRDTMDCIIETFLHVLNKAMDHPDAPVPYSLSARDEQRLAAICIGPERPDYVRAPLVHKEFERIAAESPDLKCLCYEGEWLSYGEANARADAMISRLSSLGIGPGVVVGVMLERSLELVLSIVAVLKAGGVYLPCDPQYPDDRLAIYLEDGHAAIVLVGTEEHKERAEGLAPEGTNVVDVSKISFDDGNVGGTAALSMNGATTVTGYEDPAYIIFTSGSTGRPKGVTIPHRALCDFVCFNRDRYKVTADDVTVLSVTINFDPHIMQVRCCVDIFVS